MTSKTTAADLIEAARNTIEPVFLALTAEGRDVSQTDILLDEITFLAEPSFHEPETIKARLAAAMVLLTDVPTGEAFTSRRYGALEPRVRKAWAMETTGVSLEALEALEALPEDRGGVWLAASSRIVTRRHDGTREEAWVQHLQFHTRQAVDQAMFKDLDNIIPAIPEDTMPEELLAEFRAIREARPARRISTRAAAQKAVRDIAAAHQVTLPWEAPQSKAKQPTQAQYDRLFADIIAPAIEAMEPEPRRPRILTRLMPRRPRK